MTAVAVMSLSLIASGCGGKKKDEATGGSEDMHLTAQDGESGLADAGSPEHGGTLTYAIEADSNDGFCLPVAQLAISGMTVVRAVYDTLTVPNAEGDYVPYLARSVEPNEDFTEWKITLRDGVKFHNGEDLTAEVVKNNLDAYRGKNPEVPSLLFTFVLNNIDTVEVTGDLEVTVKTVKPWASFPAFLYSSSRMGIIAQEQLDNPDTCPNKLIGTGPFKFDRWVPNERFEASANPDYWQIAPDGKPYPYVDKLVLIPMPENSVRMNALKADEVNIVHTSNAVSMMEELREGRDNGDLTLFVSEEQAEVSFVQLNNTKPPFDDENMRRALALAADRSEINDDVNGGLPTVADGPFGTDSIGYLEDPGFPQADEAEAKRLIDEYVAGGGNPAFTLACTTDATVQQLANLIRQRAEKVGVKVTTDCVDQAQLVSKAIAKDYQAMTFRNFPGGDPDLNYVWWYGDGNPVNFSGYDDPDINRLLDEGRAEADPAKRAEIYQEISRIFAEHVYSVWAWYTPWAVAADSTVHGILGPPLPGDDASQPGEESTDDPARQPNLGLATAHSLIGLWIEQ